MQALLTWQVMLPGPETLRLLAVSLQVCFIAVSVTAIVCANTLFLIFHLCLVVQISFTCFLFFELKKINCCHNLPTSKRSDRSAMACSLEYKVFLVQSFIGMGLKFMVNGLILCRPA